MKATDIKCLDSSAWLAYYFGQNLLVKELVDGGALIITSSLSLFEIKKRLITLKKDFQLLLNFIKERSELVTPTAEIAESAADFALQKKLGAMDALIYATSQAHNAELITGDNDFRNLEKVIVIS